MPIVLIYLYFNVKQVKFRWINTKVQNNSSCQQNVYAILQTLPVTVTVDEYVYSIVQTFLSFSPSPV